jgi:lactate dehydrogenase-like 2-hydroxyacid dehydrogenase
MKDGVVLVNVARGAVFDEEAVANAVLDGKIGGLGVDVYSTEPMQKDSPYQKLLERDNVIFTPHMAWGSYDARQRCIDEIEANIKSFIKGGKRSRRGGGSGAGDARCPERFCGRRIRSPTGFLPSQPRPATPAVR